MSIWGDGLRRREHWPLWLLLGAVFAGLVALTQPPRRGAALVLRLGQAGAAAALAAAYLALEFFPGASLLQGLVLASSLLCALFMVLLALPSRGGGLGMPALAALWAGALALALAAAAAVPLPPLDPEAQRLLPDSGREVEEERRAALRSAVLAVFAAQSLLLAFALKLRVAAATAGLLGGGSGGPLVGLSASVGARLDQAAGFLGACMPTHLLQPGKGMPMLKVRGGGHWGSRGRCLPTWRACALLGPPARLQPLPAPLPAAAAPAPAPPGLARPTPHPLPRPCPPAQGAGGVVLQRLSSEGLGWVPTLGNLATLACFGLCVALNQAVTGGADAGALLLAPLLLLLSQDPLLARGLEQRRRYFPPALALAAQLGGGAGARLAAAALGLGDGGGPGAAWDMAGAPAWLLLKNAALLVAALPTQADLLTWLWTGRPPALARTLALAPLCALPLALADLEGLRLLGGGGLAAGAALAVRAQHVAAAGRRIL